MRMGAQPCNKMSKVMPTDRQITELIERIFHSARIRRSALIPQISRGFAGENNLPSGFLWSAQPFDIHHHFLLLKLFYEGWVLL